MKKLFALTPLVLIACSAPRSDAVVEADVGSAFGFSHDNSVVEKWPFGFDDRTTKIVAEPIKTDGDVESYWVVRSTGTDVSEPPNGELTAEIWVHAEFPDSAFAPQRGADYEIVTGEDRNGAVTTELSPGHFEIRAPARAEARQSGFIVRARFPGDSDGQEPPKSLLVDIVHVRDAATGLDLPLNKARSARWLIVDPDSGR